MPRYLATLYSECFCQGDSGWDWGKQIALLMGVPYPLSWRHKWNKKAKRELYQPELGHQSSPALRLELELLATLILRPLSSDKSFPGSAFLGLPPANSSCRSWGLLASIAASSQFPVINLFLCIHISYWFCSSGDPWLICWFAPKPWYVSILCIK